MAAVKKPRGRHWENQETLLLLQKWGDENIQMRLLSCTRKKPIWHEISAFLRAAGYEDRDEDACKTRIHPLVSAYRSYKDECSKTGNGTPKRKPAFFNEVEELLSEKPCTKPKVVVSSSKIAIGDEDREEEEVEGDMENHAPNLPSCSSSVSKMNNNKCTEPEKDAFVTGKHSNLSPIGEPDNGLSKNVSIVFTQAPALSANSAIFYFQDGGNEVNTVEPR